MYTSQVTSKMRLLSFCLLRVGLPIIFTKPASTADQSQTSALPCMDPNSQPQLQINNDCPSSLTNLSNCLQSKSYKENCIAYCEQFLYWFHGPEVPYPNSNCQADEPCTFAGAKSLAITNTYSFSAGLSGTETDLFRTAFNLGSSYSYSTTTTNTQTFTETRPSNSTGCGYWTFLPYYVTSCGFYINSTKYSKNTWGSNFFGESSHSCGSSHDTLFGCTNTTFTDQNGEPEGDVVFINTNCTSNERLEGQDPRYYSVLAPSDLYDRDVSLDVSIFSLQPLSQQQFPRQDPLGDETCFRACLCGYTANSYYHRRSSPSSPYQACNCSQILSVYFLRKNGIPDGAVIPLTSANITLLQYYGDITCYAQVRQSGNFTEEFSSYHTRWMWVPDNDVVLKNKYECFDSFNNMQVLVFNYYNQSIGGQLYNDYMGPCG